MKYIASSLYQIDPDDCAAVLGSALSQGLTAQSRRTPVQVYFRADDIGAVSTSFKRLMALFTAYETPLCLAVVPAWLSRVRLRVLGEICDINSPRWCWHQHGWTHRNHQVSGKNAEFGPERASGAVKNDIIRGRDRLQSFFGKAFCPVFTPPWNRCSPETLVALTQAGFKAVSTDSRSSTQMNRSSPLEDLSINVDLHTRKEEDSSRSLQNLAAELKRAAAGGRIGFMIHHQRMNDNSFMVLAKLLAILNKTPEIHPHHFGTLIR